MKIPIKIPQKNVATKLEGGKALVAGPLKKLIFLQLPLGILTIFFRYYHNFWIQIHILVIKA